MLVQEIVELYGNYFRKSYSDNNKYIHKLNTEEMYDIAIDVLDSPFEYEETNIDIEAEE